MDDAVIAQRHRLDRLAVGDDAEHDLGGSATARGLSAQSMPSAISGSAFAFVAVPAGHGVAGGEQTAGDGRAHVAETDNAELHGFRSLPWFPAS